MEDSKSLRTRSVKVSTSMTIGSSRRISTSTSTRPTLGLKSPFPAYQSPRTSPNSGYPFAHRGLLTNVLRKLGVSHRVQITDSCRSSCRLVRKTVQQDRLFLLRCSSPVFPKRTTLHEIRFTRLNAMRERRWQAVSTAYQLQFRPPSADR